ncbi:phosphatidylserine decarboxylase [Candidatus Mycobacterium wuenschmannii]|uniref:Phosphatidylserine decarboxylase proenzyme n=1 Tax=Candidatus Mycobacterium wuenschmannii TaxID=3027808 RepID=A0ABY8VW06_9MYCO|nr:phosphatidylserine decarboxylase [Candidatus Mycobacterium wuenschmannii]WIM87251.1 phosphatidylserine decarboxylase [Candidatus Mycobacterium wuenschmannii]
MARRPRSTADNPTISPQHVVSLLRQTVPPVHPAGLPFISAGLGLALVGRRSRWLRRVGLLAAGACAGFFRHPPRVPPTRPGVVVAPADGQVCLIESAAPPPELEMGEAELTRVSIFLSVFDAHVQRAPVGGEVIAVQHRPGLFGSADLPDASESNERNSVWIRTEDGVDVVAVQIAGLVARRIVCNANVGDKLSIGDTYGLIRFGSRLDTYLPAGARVSVSLGQRAVAGETVLAELP